MQIDDKTWIVNSILSFKAFCAWVWVQFEEHKYLIFTITFGLSRTQEQNSKLWPMLTDISNHVEWFGKKHGKDDWKDIITGSFRKCEFVPNIDGTGFVVLGMRTSKMGKREFSALIEYIYAFGADKGVPWSEKSEQVYQEFKEQR
jgi:hypothetical protein